jgi:hypothetical protein
MKAPIFFCLFLVFVMVSQGYSESPTVERNGMSRDEFNSASDEFVAQGYRPVRIIGHGGKQPTYDSVWVKREGPPWKAGLGISRSFYNKAFHDLVKDGYRPVWVSGYEVGHRDLYATIWEKRSGPPFVGRHGLTPSQYQRISHELVGKGYREVGVSKYSVAGRTRYAGIWEK